jgi:hypothetical protein
VCFGVILSSGPLIKLVSRHRKQPRKERLPRSKWRIKLVLLDYRRGWQYIWESKGDLAPSWICGWYIGGGRVPSKPARLTSWLSARQISHSAGRFLSWYKSAGDIYS